MLLLGSARLEQVLHSFSLRLVQFRLKLFLNLRKLFLVQGVVIPGQPLAGPVEVVLLVSSNGLPASIASLLATFGTGHDVAATNPLNVDIAVPALPQPGHGQLLLHLPPGDVYHLLQVLLSAVRNVTG